MAQKAKEMGLKEICFTDHYDCLYNPNDNHYLFTKEDYSKTYNSLFVEGIKIKKGIEFGLTPWNVGHADEIIKDLDFVIGSVHYLESGDPYTEESFWNGRDVKESFRDYLESVYNCVKIHNNFDVLGHLTYVSKCKLNKTKEPVLYKDFSDVSDEIMKELATKGIGLEVNTSGIDAVGKFLPDKDFLVRFKELGGEIITVGTDSHDERRIGQYVPQALEIIKDIFGYICTFEKRKPIFNKL
jgi:histidinol-phosphatase (PHP family)